MKTSRTSRLFRCFLATSLLVNGAFQLAAPVLADGTPAGTAIQNTGTATYQDPSTGTTLNTTSNTVEITVAEIAGITNVPAGIDDRNDGSIANNDILDFDFLVTNVGNDATNIYIPGIANLTTQGLNTSTLTIQADLNNDGDFNDTGETPGTSAITATGIAAGASVRVRVTGTVAATTAGAPVSVRLGNTGSNLDPNVPRADTQNQPDNGQPITVNGATYNDTQAGVDEVRTEDDDPADTPASGEREASALQRTTVATAVTTRAFATVLKNRATYTPGTTAVDDDLLTYRLDLRVPNTTPNSSFTPGTLEGTSINLGGATVNRILVSDAIPVGTVYDSSFEPNLPTGWTRVYSTTAISGPGDDALAAEWNTSKPNNDADITRVGFVFTGTLAPGTTTTNDANGFQFRVVTTNLPPSGGTVANIAQVFGETQGDASNTIIYDQSGDQNPNNFNDDGTPGAAFNTNTDNGVADPATQGTDSGNNNAGTGTGGEANTIAIVAPGSILNGPNNQPGAVGPNDNNNDFFNKTVTNLPEGDAGSIDPSAVSFTNTVQNPSTNASNLDNVVLRPIPPSVADTATTSTNRYGANGDLPNNTRVTVTLGNRAATYIYDGTAFNLDSSTTGGANDTTATPIRIASLTPGTQRQYTVSVDLPGSPDGTAQVEDFSVPVVAFVDNDTDATFDPGSENVFNIVINRAYTGYVRLVKESRILRGTGPVVGTGQGDFATTPGVGDASNDVERTPAPGNIVEYRITYTNISTPQAGSGNVVLSASNLVITEDGATSPNNWASTTTHQQATDIAAGTTVQFYNGTTLLGSSDPATGTAVTEYRNNVGTLAPQATDDFTFQREVNDE